MDLVYEWILILGKEFTVSIRSGHVDSDKHGAWRVTLYSGGFRTGLDYTCYMTRRKERR